MALVGQMEGRSRMTIFVVIFCALALLAILITIFGTALLAYEQFEEFREHRKTRRLVKEGRSAEL